MMTSMPPLQTLPGVVPAWQETVSREDLRSLCLTQKEQGARLVSLWGSDEGEENFDLHLALAVQGGLRWLRVSLPAHDPTYPALDDVFANANRLQRATHDLLGLLAQGAAESRPWLRHSAWPADRFPLRKGEDGQVYPPLVREPYPFVTVSGQGVHEIPVGPVHAGIIEPGHFRFSVVGERVLRLDTQLGYTHKGIEKRAESLAPAALIHLAGRVSGDSTVAGAWATAQALESILGRQIPERAEWLRALWLERERLVNHLGDLGYLCNDVGLSAGFSLFWALKETALRTHEKLVGHRYLHDQIQLGGVARALTVSDCQSLREEGVTLEREVHRLQELLQEHAGVQDRYVSTGRVTPELAARLGLVGLAGRASAQAWDLRVSCPTPPYAQAEVRMATRTQGDVAARVAVRFDEVFESLRLIRHFIEYLPSGPSLWNDTPPLRAGVGVGWVEGWRGEVFVALELGAQGQVRRWHPEDVSMSNWPVLEHAVQGNIVPDFPLINKSFNLSYSGQDG
ncbi:NADH-quinone oxidoreductase subunit C [Ferrovum myxofaciens]|jgi:Ni,Fe-hydrogenase III large subunit/Ni,Fe-hydrogenase III component G|nr:NADH-quinone oxidoreductase subunit C [Ferrovum myxofaciens]MBU6995757.1 NADH-quinone oxidoreductase subunit C [Ferrovum myxofaciens]QKE39455.1 MAG: NADH-quinone oxidoreductase subunit C [Ferrovum myxofaciens]